MALKDILAVDQMAISLKMFKRYVYTNNIPTTEAMELTTKAIELGVNKAKEIKERFFHKSVSEILQELKVTIKEENKKSGDTNFVKMAEFAVKGKIITINEHSVEVINKQLRKAGEKAVAKDIILTHELFHYFEYFDWGIVSKQFIYPVKVLFLTFKRSLLPMSEIAANAFAKEFLQLDFEPMLIEKLYFQGISDNKKS